MHQAAAVAVAAVAAVAALQRRPMHFMPRHSIRYYQEAQTLH
jgi:hypothetical protein